MFQYPTFTPYTLGPEQADTACLLIHGFSGMPGELRGLGEVLAAHGLRVYGMLVAGHSGHPDEMLRAGRKQWIASTEEALAHLDSYRHVIVIGFSMGGVLALRLAARQQERVAGVVVLSTPTRFTGGWQIKAVPLARYVMKWFYPLSTLDLSDPAARSEVIKQARMRVPDIEIDFSNEAMMAELNKMVRLPVPAIAELFALTNEERRNLQRIKSPLLIIQSRADQVVNPECASELYRLASNAAPKTLYWLERSDHLIALGPEREDVAREVLTFIETTIPGAVKTVPPDHAPTEALGGTLLDH